MINAPFSRGFKRRAKLHLLRAILALFAAFAIFSSAQAQTMIEVTDLAGRTVKVKAGSERIILGEGRLLYGTGILDKEDPFKRLAGWAEDLILFDPGTYRAYKAKFPHADKVARFTSAYTSDFSAEKALTLNPDVVIFPLSAVYKLKELGTVEKLEKAGIPSVFIDLREDPLQNTVPSMLLLGQIFGKQAEAQEFVNFYLRETRKVTVRVAKKPDAKRKLVIMERAAGYDTEKCCMTFGNTNLGAVLQAAGAVNWGARKFSGLGGDINPETIFAENPDIIIGTGADWSEAVPGTYGVPFGYEAKEENVQKNLKFLANRKGWDKLKAVETKQFYSVYHQFYTSPAHLVVLQVFAKWVYPDEFKDIDPDATFAEYHKRFSPIPYSGLFWAQLK